MNKFFHTFRLLSLDVVLGALCSAYMVVLLLEVKVPTIFWIALPISVWVIYTADHLLDAYRLKDQAHTPRHLFHYTYFRSIAFAFLLAGALCVFLFPFLVPVSMLYFAAFMGAFTGVHFLLVKWVGERISPLFLKELGVALIYAAGVWGAPWVLAGMELELPENLFFLQFFLLALINLLTFSMYEMETDQLDGHTSFVLAIGKKTTKALLYFLSILVLVFCAMILSKESSPLVLMAESIFLLMLFVLVWVFVDERRFGKTEAYRAWADAVFLFPGISFFYAV
ncbi:MAG: hypothetical protein R8P61_12240 [Bacteroidia bacterium]|nr:hypothetical protein [Bacteroidia bacterium]